MKKIIFILSLLIIFNTSNAQGADRFGFGGTKYTTFLDEILGTISGNNFVVSILTSLKPTETKKQPEKTNPVDDFNNSVEMKKAVQKYLGVEADGKYGTITKNAIKSFQKENGLDETGMINQETLKKLDEEMDSNKNNEVLPGLRDGNHECNRTGDLVDKRNRFTVLEDCWIQGDTGHFGTEWDGSADKTPGQTKNFNMNYAKTTSMGSYAEGGKVNILNPEIGVVSLPAEVQKYYFGQNLSLEEIKKKYAGTPIEIVNIQNRNCVVAPLWETGPGNDEISKPKAIDLTPIVKKQIGGKSFISKFRPVQKGKKGCEGYNLKFVFQDQIKRKDSKKTQVAELKK